MLFMSKTKTPPRPAFAIAARARPSRYSWRRRKSTRSSQSTAIRPGAGTAVTVKSDLEAIRYRPLVGHELEICVACLQLQQSAKIDVPQALPEERDDDLMGERRHRQWNVHLTAKLQPQLQVLAHQLAGHRGREVEVDEGGRLVPAEGRSHH